MWGTVTSSLGAALHRQELLLVQFSCFAPAAPHSSRIHIWKQIFPQLLQFMDLGPALWCLPSTGTRPPRAAQGQGCANVTKHFGHLGIAELGKGGKQEELSTAGGQERGNLLWEGQYLHWPWCPGHKPTLPGSLQGELGLRQEWRDKAKALNSSSPNNPTWTMGGIWGLPP